MKFLISHTWNGDGMSNSEIHILDSFSNHIKRDVQKMFLIQDMQNIKYENNTNSFYYNLNNDLDDTGRIRFEPLPNDALAVALFPNINESEIITDNHTIEEYIKDVLNDEWNEHRKIYDYLADVEYEPNYLMLCTLPVVRQVNHF